jgi:hypothetical protein
MKPTTRRSNTMKIFHDIAPAEDTFADDGGYLMREHQPTLRGCETIYVVYDHETAIDCGYSDEYLAATEANGFRNFRVRA